MQAIRPYPVQYVSSWTMKDGTPITIRPIRPEDEPEMVKFHEALSERSVYHRYFHMANLSSRVAHERLTRMCSIDYDREMALVAEHPAPKTGTSEILGVGRLIKRHRNEAEVAVTIRDQYQRRGLGTELLRRLVQVGRDEHLDRLVAHILQENYEMQALGAKCGFKLSSTDDPECIHAILDLRAESDSPRL